MGGIAGGVNAKLDALSDHAKQTADITLKNGKTLRIVTHNMMEQCRAEDKAAKKLTNNAWNTTESSDEYDARLNKLLDSYVSDASNGVGVIALQEGPKDQATKNNFIAKMKQRLGSNWDCEEQLNDRGQPMLMFYNKSEVGTPIGRKAELNGAAQVCRFSIDGEKVDLINVHLKSVGQDPGKIQKVQSEITDLMKAEQGVTKVRFGDHNGDRVKFSDLQSGVQPEATSISFDSGTGGFHKKINKYDGFAVSGANVQIKVHRSDMAFKVAPDGQTVNVIQATDKIPPLVKNPHKLQSQVIPTKRKHPVQERARASVSVTSGHGKAMVEAREAQDRVLIPNATTHQVLQSGGLVASQVDPITKAIRTEILAKQQLELKSFFIQNTQGIEQGGISVMNADQFKAHLATEQVKPLLEKALRDSDVIKKLSDLETSGYKKIHEEFKDNFKDMSWRASDVQNTKESQIKNDAGAEVATIKETTHKTSPAQTVQLENGENVTLDSYRTIDFPLKLETKNGPLHLSMAVKDQNGKNISEKDAVYFTAHYDDSGKLSEISSPVPVKFAGEGKDAIGYIEKNGKLYTLPVTRNQYEELTKKVAKNKGVAVNLSVEAEKAAGDKMVAGVKSSQEQAKEVAKALGQRRGSVPSATVVPKPVQRSRSNSESGLRR